MVKRVTVKKKAAPKRKALSRTKSVGAESVGAVKALRVAAEHAKFTGYEPEWNAETFDEDSRKMQLMNALNWYNYHFGAKDATQMVLDYLKAQGRHESIKMVKKAPDGSIPNGVAWLCRMSFRGWPISEEEQKRIDSSISSVVEVGLRITEESTVDETVAKVAKPSIQDRMREKAAEAGGELDGMFDEFIAAGAKAKHDFQPIGVLKAANILPQHTGDLVAYWTRTRDELSEALEGTDADLTEAYSRFTKPQLKNLIKFCDTIIADLNSYVTFKKANKTPRKRKQKTPEQQVAKLKYLKEFPELGLTSIKPAQIVGSKELFVFSTKKRKLQYYVADDHAGGELVVKNNTIVGFDPNKSVAKTLRKPQEQIKALQAASKPNSRKVFADIKAVETKLSGRFADDLIILRVG
jgi:hypothetical protein